MTRRRVAVVGAGLAGLVAAIAAQEAGADVVLLERHDEPGGCTRDSAGWTWRYRDAATARTCAPHGDPVVQGAVVERLDEDLAWLERRGVELRSRDTGRAITVGARIEPRQAIDALVERLDAGDPEALQLRRSVQRSRRLDDGTIGLEVRRLGPSGAHVPVPGDQIAADAVVFAGGGYATDLRRIGAESGAPDAAWQAWVARSSRAGDGSSLDAACALGAMRVPATGESLVRLVPAGATDDGALLVRMGELQVPGSTLHGDLDGPALEQEPYDWSGAAVAWRFARAYGNGVLQLDRAALRTRIHAGGTVEETVRAAAQAGADAGRLAGGGAWLRVRAGITGTRCGLRVDGDGRLVRRADVSGRGGRDAALEPIAGAFAAGIDAADPGMGGIGSGLALALVLGRRAGTLAAGG